MMYSYETLTPGHVYRTQCTVRASDVMLYRAILGESYIAARPPMPPAGYAPGDPGPGAADLAPSMLILGYVSQVLSGVFPGRGTEIVSLTTLFVSRVRPGRCVDIELIVAEKLARHRQLRVRVAVRERRRMVMAGEVVLLPPPA